MLIYLGDEEPELARSRAYGVLVHAFLNANPVTVRPPQTSCLDSRCLPVLSDGGPTLEAILAELAAVPPSANPPLPIGTLPKSATLPLSALQQRRERMRDELCLQRRMDRRWGGLLATMAPACVQAGVVLGRIDAMLNTAITMLQVGQCPVTDFTLPDTIEELPVDIATATASIDGKIWTKPLDPPDLETTDGRQ